MAGVADQAASAAFAAKSLSKGFHVLAAAERPAPPSTRKTTFILEREDFLDGAGVEAAAGFDGVVEQCGLHSLRFTIPGIAFGFDPSRTRPTM